MSKEVEWKKVINGKTIKEIFVEESHLLDIALSGNERAMLLYEIFDLHTKGKSASQIATYLDEKNNNYSESRIYDFIRHLKQIYDDTQAESKLLPKRKIKYDTKIKIINDKFEAIDIVNKINFDRNYIEIKIIEK